MFKLEHIGQNINFEYILLLKSDGNSQIFEIGKASDTTLKYKIKRIKKHFKPMIDNGFKLEVRIKKTVEIFYKDEEV
jgi:hypothetical protein